MDRQFATQQSLAGCVEEHLRQFLQPKTRIPSSDSLQELLQHYAAKSQGHGHPTRIVSSGSVQNPAGLTGNPAFPLARPALLPISSMPTPSAVGLLNRPVPDGLTTVKYPEPDVRTMVFDPRTGYRFDQTTGLYYDANADLFMNMQLNVLLKWNPVTGTYTLVGRASDIAEPALARDLARLVNHSQIAVNSSTSTANTPAQASISVPHPVKEKPTFERERSLDFEEMSPAHEDVTDRYSPILRDSPVLSKHDVGNARRRSLSFDEMTPEPEDIFPSSVFPCGKEGSRDRSPESSRERSRRNTSRSPRRRESRYSPDGRLSSRSPRRRDRGYSPDGRRSRDRSRGRYLASPVRGSGRGRSPSRGSPGRSRSQSRRRSGAVRNRKYSPVGRRSRERDSSSSSASPTRRHGLVKYRRSPIGERPRRTTSRSPRRREFRDRRYSPGKGRSPDRTASRSPKRRDAVQARRYSPVSRRNRDRDSNNSFASSTRRRSPTRNTTPLRNRPSPVRDPPERSIRTPEKRSPRRNVLPSSTSHTRLCPEPAQPVTGRQQGTGFFGRGDSPKDRTKSDLAACTVRDAPEDTDPPPSTQKDSLLVKGPSSVAPTPVGSLPPSSDTTSKKEFSRPFMTETIIRIHKTNLLNPLNNYGRLCLGAPSSSNFLMLTPLPHKGDREWTDLETLIGQMLENEGVEFLKVTAYPGDGGAPFNYCLIHFKSAQEAFRFFMVHNGSLELSAPDGSTCLVFMLFVTNNWKCNNCRTMNFTLRSFCHKCFSYPKRKNKPPVQVSPLATEYVGITGLDCRYAKIEDVLVNFPPLDAFDFVSVELLAETNSIPLGLIVFKFKHVQDAHAFYIFLQESCLEPVFIKIIDRIGLSVNAVLGDVVKGKAPVTVPMVACADTRELITPPQPFATLTETDLEKEYLQWWRFVPGYEEGADIMKSLFEENPDTRMTSDSVPALVVVGPIPMPVACSFQDFRENLFRFCRINGVSAKNANKIAICRARNFGAPYHYCLVGFESKLRCKDWVVTRQGKLSVPMENGSSWVAYVHFTKPNWLCQHCHKMNFPVRVQCFSCYKHRLLNHTPVTIVAEPTCSIAITGYQNWCATEELLHSRLPFLREIPNLTVAYLKEPSGVPLGICVLKSATVGASKDLFNKLQDSLTNEIARAGIVDPKRPLLVYIA